MRVLDSKREQTRAAVADAPRIVDALSSDAADRFRRVRDGLDAADVAYRVDPGLVRGLDYYTHTTFEFAGLALESAQNALGGGGRYDGLAEALGGPATPGIGFGSGIERTLLACDAEGVFGAPDRAPDVFIVDVAGGDVGPRPVGPAPTSRDRRRPGVRRPVDAGPDEAGRPLRLPAGPSSSERTRSPPVRCRCATCTPPTATSSASTATP